VTNADKLLETIEIAKHWLRGGNPRAAASQFAQRFAEALVQLAEACPTGFPCAKHGGAVHGQEAEELRSGIEQIVGNIADVKRSDAVATLASTRKSLQFLTDRIDARDSLVYLDKLEASNVLLTVVLNADIHALPAEVQAARRTYQLPAAGIE